MFSFKTYILCICIGALNIVSSSAMEKQDCLYCNVQQNGMIKIYDCIYKYFSIFNDILLYNNSVRRNIGARFELIVTTYYDILDSLVSDNLTEEKYQDILKPIFINNSSNEKVIPNNNNNESVLNHAKIINNDFNMFKNSINNEILQYIKSELLKCDKKTLELVLNNFKKEELEKCAKSEGTIKYFRDNIDKYHFFNPEQIITNKPIYYDNYIKEVKGMLTQGVLGLRRNRNELKTLTAQNMLEKHSLNTAYATVEFITTKNATHKTILLLPTSKKKKINNINNNNNNNTINSDIVTYLYDVSKYLKNINCIGNNPILMSTNNNVVNKIKQKILDRIIICKFYSGRSQILDDEFQMLCTLILDSDEIVKNIQDCVIDKININIFTYMDMCPSCWSSWSEFCSFGSEFKKDINNLYMELLSNKVSRNFNVNVSTHSIKPYDDRDHLFVREYNRVNNLSNQDHNNFIPMSKWGETSYCGNYYRRNKSNNNIQFDIKQCVDTNRVIEVIKFAEGKELERIENNKNNTLK